ncbi:conserved hypothetical protein [Histoplasma capsulatum var. duboisii H88]|uniref:Uncharacterized protein n=1 Tax=Ajellomyces capsulatus (strain H88) TaxID=544711 RepID=F0U5M1_AJEC8|nr:conserved hypothetical protein [Histoplasma capsulatum var. duboisii H88]
MGFDNWINMHLTNDLEGPLATQNSQLRHPRTVGNSIYANDHEDDEISTKQVDEIVVPEPGSGGVYSCGRQGAPIGTQGSFDLVDQDTLQEVCTISCASPYSRCGHLSASGVNRNYSCGIAAVSSNGPANFVDIDVAEL